MAESLAARVAGWSWEDLEAEAVAQLKLRVLDALGCAIGALESPAIDAAQRAVAVLDGGDASTWIGGGRSSVARASFVNAALIRYLDFNDAYAPAGGGGGHPSDTLGPVLSVTEHVGGSGRELLTALAIAYQVQCRLSDVVPDRTKVYDHAATGSFAVAAATSWLLDLDVEQTADAIGIAGTALNGLRSARTGRLSHWKGLAYPYMTAGAVEAAFLASAGVTGPREAFEGRGGFMEAFTGPFEVAWEREGLDAVLRTILKPHNAQVHCQVPIQVAVELHRAGEIDPGAIDRVVIETFQWAYDNVGGGLWGDKHDVATKEHADHSLPFVFAAALLDGEVTPSQYERQRFLDDDVRALMRRIHVDPVDALTARFPERHPYRVHVGLRDGSTRTVERDEYPGFTSQPLGWEEVAAKFSALVKGRVPPAATEGIVATVAEVEHVAVRDLCERLALDD